ncbi:MAG: tripartite tricarboxylate transporter permease [Lawsonibacter sp.]|jgi:putative tricarboxylic transport membrane protein
MLEALTSSFINLFTPHTALGLFVGVVGGMVIGALPGLSATMGIALLIPVTYGMDPAAALTMLASIYTSAIYGGSISAILIHTPGTPSSAATCLDGYPMTQKGEALHAIGISTVSSCIGGFLSAIALLVIAPLLAMVSLAFSSSEYFLIAIFGLTLIASLAGKSVIKGLIAGAIGLVAGLIGMSPDAYARFTFQIPALLGGVSLIPAMIGLFSISQVMIQAEERGLGHSTVKEEAEIKGRFMPPLSEIISLLPLILKCTVVGIFVGILPGAGGDIASWVGLNMAKNSSKTPELFGTGHAEGIAAPEAANNAVTGGALIPLLTLGIPGSSTAAVLLGGLTIHGLQPGYQLFDKYADITYAVILGFMAANILMGLVGWAVGRHVVKVSKVPLPLLIPCITVFSILGSYAASQNMTDVYVAVIFGIIGYLMRKYGVPPAPVVLGLILGPMADSHFYQAVRMANGPIIPYMLSRPISIVIIIMIIAALFAPIISRIVAKRYKNKYGDVGEAAEDV